MRNSACVVLLALANQACNDPSAPPLLMPAVGTYAYSSTSQAGPGSPELSYAGTITIISASRGAIRVVWDVDGFTTTDRPGFWINDYAAYTISANTTDLFVPEVRHRIRQSSTQLDCTGDVTVVRNGSTVTQPLTCSMVLQAP